MSLNHRQQSAHDQWLLLSAIGLILFGLLMVASASMVVAEREFHAPMHFLWRQVAYLIVALPLSVWVYLLPQSFWQRNGPILLLFSMVLLVLVLVPGLGRHVNGSARWLGVGPLSFQVSELVKLFVFIYIAGYLERHQREVQDTITGFIKPLGLLAIIGVLLLLEPDFGATVVMLTTVLAMMFLAGARFRYFAIMVCLAILLFVVLAVSSPYRMQRLTGFLNPWQHEYGSGYQLTQSLIAFGRGGLTGVGLGNSVQKLFYLPEAHTDFLFAVLAEELGLIGILVVMALFTILVWRGLVIAKQAFMLEHRFSAYLANGLAIWIAIQTMINMGVNAGLLPTKGLTLPFMSYGGSSMLVMCVVIALLMRIDRDNRALLNKQRRPVQSTKRTLKVA